MVTCQDIFGFVIYLFRIGFSAMAALNARWSRGNSHEQRENKDE
jgi:hypothetical protein